MDIAIIDSGIGGMCLLPYFFKQLPLKKYLYFADTKNLPYGSKTTKQLLEITIKNVKFIIKKYNPKIIVFGCNTIGVSVFEKIKEIFPKQIFFSIKPDINNCYFTHKKTLVLATTKTIKTIKRIYSFYVNKNKNIILCKMPSLANKIENNLQNLQNIMPYLKRRLIKYKGVKYIVLGCTHYYFVNSQIQKLFKKAKIIDGIEVLTKQILLYLNILNTKDKKKLKPKIKLFLSKNTKQKIIYKKIIKDFIHNN